MSADRDAGAGPITPDRSAPSFDERAAALAAIAYRVSFRILGQRPDAQDVTQEALARAYARWSRVGPYDEAWITRVATNLALGVARRGRVARRHARTRRVDAGPPADGTRLVDQRRELVAALRRLPRRQRQVVALRYLADLSEKDVAAALGCSPGTVKQHASRGLDALRRALADEVPTDPSPEPELEGST
jgi:RNA polymerase sigma factor (sigma-70 family)